MGWVVLSKEARSRLVVSGLSERHLAPSEGANERVTASISQAGKYSARCRYSEGLMKTPHPESKRLCHFFFPYRLYFKVGVQRRASSHCVMIRWMKACQRWSFCVS